MEKDHARLVRALEPVVKVKMKEELASCLVRVMQKRHFARRFLSDVVMDEVERTGARHIPPVEFANCTVLAMFSYPTENNSIAFRGNTIATKAMEAYMKLVGERVRPVDTL